jgi:outer membrane receptor protein involved in Fe transport
MYRRLRGGRGYAVTVGTIILDLSVLTFASARADDVSTEGLQEVIVTARRQAESAMKVPETISVLDSSALSKLGVTDFQDFASHVPLLSYQWGGSGGGNGAELGFGGARAIAIRGVSGAGTTAVYIDDTPVPMTIDPQVVDIDRVEVLKGPQGTLYGAGSMGGNVRYVTNAPAFSNDFKFSVSAGYTDHAGSPDGRMEVIGNVPIADGVAAARVVAFAGHDGGFITREFTNASGQLIRKDNQGAVTTYGGSLSFLIKATDKFSITPRILAQYQNSHGLADAFAPLPAFAVESLTLYRVADVQEAWTDKWYLPSLELKYTGQSWDLISSTSYFQRYLYNLEDGTEGTMQALVVPPYNAPPSIWAGGVAWPQTQKNYNFYQELRAVWQGTEHVRGIFGAFYSDERQNWENGSPTFNFPDLVTTGTFNSPLLWDQRINTRVKDKALYGEVYFKANDFELTLGARKYWFNYEFWNDYNGFLNFGYSTIPTQHTSENGFNPKASLSYTAPNGTLMYMTAAKGFRPGGPNNPLPAACDPGLMQLGITASQIASYHSDTLWNYEIGAKGRIDGVSLTGALFQMNWNQIQQAFPIPICFIPATGNAGAARIRGGEIEAVGRPVHDVEFRVGIGYQDPRITEKGLTPQPVGSRILQVPFFTGSVAVTYTHPIAQSVDGFATMDYGYTGSSLSATTTALFGEPPAERAGYGILNARFGARWDVKQLSLYLRNITNVKANLGDINPLAYPQSNPTTGLLQPRVAVSTPFQIGVEFTYGM